jgi:hypothetical protein
MGSRGSREERSRSRSPSPYYMDDLYSFNENDTDRRRSKRNKRSKSSLG